MSQLGIESSLVLCQRPSGTYQWIVRLKVWVDDQSTIIDQACLTHR